MSGADDRPPVPAVHQGPLAIVCGSGSLPFAVAEAVSRQGRQVVLFPLRGWADAARLRGYEHHWIRLGNFGGLCRLARAAGCRELVMIGGLVRPSLVQLWPDLRSLLLLPRAARLFRGGDNHLLSGLAVLFAEQGLTVVGAHEVAPGITMPRGLLGRHSPSERDRADIIRGIDLLQATAPFDVGQAAVVAGQRVLAIEAADGTDEMLAQLARLRANGRVRGGVGSGVLVKAAKVGQDFRIDLPSIGPSTVEGAARAGLAGIAVVAGSAVVAESERIASTADRAGLFVIGVGADGTP
jgi:DUF1009 family protein